MELSIIIKSPHLFVRHAIKVVESKTKVGIACRFMSLSEAPAYIVSDMRNDKTITDFRGKVAVLCRFRKKRGRVLIVVGMEKGSLDASNESGGKSQGGHKEDGKVSVDITIAVSACQMKIPASCS